MKLTKTRGLALIVLIALLVVGFALVSLTEAETASSGNGEPRNSESAFNQGQDSSYTPSSQDPLSQEPLSQDFAVCDINDLPSATLPVIDDILSGGPYDYPRNDDGIFGNYEEFLPSESNGYYREYTVKTPGLDHRGARRIVTGGITSINPEHWYYTADHYESFCEFTDSL